MKLKEYIKNLQEVLDEHGDIDVIYSSDDEGNYYGKVNFKPSVGSFTEDGADSSFRDEDEFEEMIGDGWTPTVNAVCIN